MIVTVDKPRHLSGGVRSSVSMSSTEFRNAMNKLFSVDTEKEHIVSIDICPPSNQITAKFEPIPDDV